MTRRRLRPRALHSLTAASLLFCSVTLSALTVTQLDASSTEGKHGRERPCAEDSAARADTCTTKSTVEGSDTSLSKPDPLAAANARDGAALAARPLEKRGRATATMTRTEIHAGYLLQQTTRKSLLHSSVEIGDGRDHLTTGEDVIDSILLKDPDKKDGPASSPFSMESGTECSAKVEADSEVAHEAVSHQEERTLMNGPCERRESLRDDDVTNRNDDAAEQQNTGEIRGSAIGAGANMMQTVSIAVKEKCGGPVSCTWDPDAVGSKEEPPTVTASGGEEAASMARFSTRPNGDDRSVCLWQTGAIGSFGQSYTIGSFDDERPVDSRDKSVIDQVAADPCLSESLESFSTGDDVVVVEATAGALSDGAHAEEQHNGGEQGKEGGFPCEDIPGRGDYCRGSVDNRDLGSTAPTSFRLPDGTGFVELVAVREATVSRQAGTDISRYERSAITAGVQSGGGHIGGSLVAGGIPGTPNGENESIDGKNSGGGADVEPILGLWSREGLDGSILQGQEGSECAPPYSMSSASSLDAETESSCSSMTSCEDMDTDREPEIFLTAVPTDLGPENVRGPRQKGEGVSFKRGPAPSNGRADEVHEGHAAREEARDGLKRPESAQNAPQPVLKSQVTDSVIPDSNALGVEVASIGSKEDRGGETDADGSMDVADIAGIAGAKKIKETGQDARVKRKETNRRGKAASPAEVVGQAGGVAKVQQHSWWRVLGWWAIVAVVTICAGFVYTGGEIIRWVPGFGDSRYRRWGLDLDAAIASARSRGPSFLDSASGYPPHNDGNYSDLPDLVSDERSSAEGATVKGHTSRHGDAAAADNVIWDSRPKRSPDVLVFDPVLGVVPFGVLEAWEQARPEARTQQPRPRQAGEAESEINICRNGDALLSLAPLTLPGAWGGIFSSRESLLRSGHWTAGVVGAAAADAVPNTERKMKKKRPLPPVRYSPEWHAWLAARHEGQSSQTLVNGEKQPSIMRQAPATNGKGSNVVSIGGCGAGGDGAAVVVGKGGPSRNGDPSHHLNVGPRAAVGLHSGNSTGNSVVLEMNGERASSVGSSAHCGGIDDNAWH